MLSSSIPIAEIDPLELYASAIDTSDYVAAIAPVLRQRLVATGDLLDIGAGGGQLGDAIREAGRRWTAIEPAAPMRQRLARFVPAPGVVAQGWQEAAVADGTHDTVLAATMPAFFDQPAVFLDRCRRWARKAVAWVVPKHAGPRGLCFAGCLPAEWHGEDETPGLEVVMRGLAPDMAPLQTAMAHWTFTGVVPDLPRLARYLASRLGWPNDDPRRPLLLAHLQAKAQPDDRGARLEIPRTSAILIWKLA